MAVPKIFAFDAVFTQDASQVRASLCVCVCVLEQESYFSICYQGIQPLKGKGTSLYLQGVTRGLEKKMPFLGQGAFLATWA